MPGKVNPTQSEAMTMVVAQVFGNDLAISFGASQGNFELNVFNPVMILQLPALDDAAARRVHDVPRARGRRSRSQREEIIKGYLDQSLMVVTALAPHIGYDKAAEIAKHAHHKKSTLKEAALEFGHVTSEQYDKIVVPKEMTYPK